MRSIAVPVLESITFPLWTMYQARAAHASPRRVAAIQERRFRRLLRHAAAHSAFYREKFRGIDLDRCSPSDLPVTTKGEMMADLDRVITDPDVRRADLERFIDNPDNVGRLFLDRYPVCHTSGSQGQSLFVVQNRLTLDVLFSLQMTRGNVGYRSGPIEALRRLVNPGRLAVVISRQGFFPSAWVWQHLPKPLRPFVRTLFVAANDPDLRAKLAAFRPTVLNSTPTVLEMLAVRGDADVVRPSLRQVVPASETLTDRARARIADAFGAPILDTYGCGECLFLTNGCPTDAGSHVNADWAILEVVDADGQPVPPGQPGHKVLMTNLANTVQPFIRYEIGDRAVIAAEPCHCGSRLPRIARLEGRASDLFWVRTGTGYRPLLTYPFQHAFEYVREVREWQAVQVDRNRVRVRLELLPGATLDREKARRKLDERLETVGLRGDVEVELEVVPRLEWDQRTGKFRRLVSQVGPPEDLPPNQTSNAPATAGAA